jgi:peptidoglycan/LPS O-acetylase OafA/YrhL
MNFADRMDAANGRPTGFDYMRLALAISVVATHSIITTYGRAADHALLSSAFEPFMRAILPMFFCLSGFLVTGSLLRCQTLVSFLGLRVIRIYPALAVEVLISALILGPIFTSVTLAAYFGDPLFWQYLWNVTGHIHYLLPGVFADNPFPDTVNAQLWTVPWELLCYAMIAILTLFGVKTARAVAPIGVVVLSVLHLFGRLQENGWTYVQHGGGLSGEILVISFVVGVAFYLYRDTIKASAPLFVLALALSIYFLWSTPLGEYFGIYALGYVVAYLGTANPAKIGILQGADYSYGIFLYGFSVQQAFVALFPTAEWYTNILVCVPLSALVAALSWHYVEKPALGLKKGVFGLERMFLTQYMKRSDA